MVGGHDLAAAAAQRVHRAEGRVVVDDVEVRDLVVGVDQVVQLDHRLPQLLRGGLLPGPRARHRARAVPGREEQHLVPGLLEPGRQPVDHALTAAVRGRRHGQPRRRDQGDAQGRPCGRRDPGAPRAAHGCRSRAGHGRRRGDLRGGRCQRRRRLGRAWRHGRCRRDRGGRGIRPGIRAGGHRGDGSGRGPTGGWMSGWWSSRRSPSLRWMASLVDGGWCRWATTARRAPAHTRGAVARTARSGGTGRGPRITQEEGAGQGGDARATIPAGGPSASQRTARPPGR